MFCLAPDKFNRLSFASGYINTLREHGLNQPSILDLGANENLLSRFLNGYLVTQADIECNSSAVNFIQCTAESTPFADNAFDIVVCLDVLEHISESKRNKILDEISRITSHTAILAFPIEQPINVQIESLVGEIWEHLYKSPNKFLLEHRTFGLVRPSKITDHLNKRFRHCDKFLTFPWQLWIVSHLFEHYLGMLPATQSLKQAFFNMINGLSTRIINETEAYRAIVIASDKPLHDFQEYVKADVLDSDASVSSDDIVSSFKSTHSALEQLHGYSLELEQKLTQTTRQLEESVNQNKAAEEKLKRFNEQSSSADYERLERYALHLEQVISANETMITELQEQLTNLLIQKRRERSG
jgi:hypothetical protein